MIATQPETHVDALEERLARGAALLFDMEQRGDMGADYARWLDHYVGLLEQYEMLHGEDETLAA